MDLKHTLPAAVLISALFCASSAFAQDEVSASDENVQEATQDETIASSDGAKADDEKADKKDDDKRWSIGATLGFNIGTGAFVKNEYARKIRSRYYLSLEGGYKIPVIDTDIEVSTGFSHWLSAGGDTNGPQRFRWQDSSIGFSKAFELYKGDESSIALGVGLHFTLPTSTSSINSKLYTEIAPSIAFSASLAKFSFAYSIEYTHSFHKFTSVALDPTEVDVLSRSDGVELLSSHEVAVDGVLTEIALKNAFQVSYAFIKQLKLAVSFGFVDYWTYDTDSISSGDQYTSQYAHVGRGHSQWSAGALDLIYLPSLKWNHFALDFFLRSEQPWKTKDNKEYRFPWFDTVSYAKNYTKFGLNVIFTY